MVLVLNYRNSGDNSTAEAQRTQKEEEGEKVGNVRGDEVIRIFNS